MSTPNDEKELMTEGAAECSERVPKDVFIGFIRNPYLNNADEDFLFHLKLGTRSHDLKAMFHDVKFVCMGGTVHRMKNLAAFLRKELGYPVCEESELQDLTAEGHRYSMYKVGCVLCVNHGMGYASIAILLHELIKLMHYSEVSNPIFFRTGTSGGFGIPSGAVVIANKVINEFLEPYCEVPILGSRVKRPAVLDQHLAEELKTVSEKLEFSIALGTTLTSEHFYESTASKSGAIREPITDIESKEYFDKLKLHDVLNVDMETAVFASITHLVGIKAAVVNVVTNRETKNPQDELVSDAMCREWEDRPRQVVAEYIKKYFHN